MNELSNRRDSTLDAAKGIGILLVVFAHINLFEPWQSIIYGFHMPLFYTISGMLFRKERYSGFWDFFKRRLKTLILPYLLFSFLSLLFATALFLMNPEAGSTSKLSSYFIQIFIAQRSGKLYNNPLWFVPNLLLLECMYYYLSGIKSKPLLYLVIFVLVVFGWYTESAYCPWDFAVLPWNFSSALFAMGYYAIGNNFRGVLTDPIPPLLRNSPVLRRVIIMIVCFAIEVPLAILNGHVTIGSRELNNGFIFYATGILGTMGTLALAGLLKNSRFFTFCGRASFYIMATHTVFETMVFIVMKRAFSYSMDPSLNSWGQSTFVLIVVTIMSVVFSWLYMKAKARIQEKHQKHAAAA